MRRMPHWVVGIILVVIGGFVLFGLTQGALPNGLTLLVGVLFVTAGFFVILLGRDFFDVYLLQSMLALIVLYAAALGSANFVAQYNARSDAPPPTSSSPTRPATPQSGVGLLNPETPGTLLVLFVATITVVGFTITVQRLQESHVRITTYEAFLSRLARLLRKTLQIYGEPVSRLDEIEAFFTSPKSSLHRISKPAHFYENNADGLKILCRVPTLGNMSHQNSYLSYVHGLWLKIGQSKKIPIETVCVDGSDAALKRVGLTWDNIKTTSEGEDFADNNLAASRSRDKVVRKTSVGQFYNSFVKRGFSEEEVRRGVVQAVEVIRLLGDGNHKNQLLGYDWPDPGEGKAVPHFSLFWTRTRAIIAFPLDRGVPRDKMKKVTMIGYETTDPDVIEKLLDVYEEYKKLLRNSSGNGTLAPIMDSTP